MLIITFIWNYFLSPIKKVAIIGISTVPNTDTLFFQKLNVLFLVGLRFDTNQVITAI